MFRLRLLERRFRLLRHARRELLEHDEDLIHALDALLALLRTAVFLAIRLLLDEQRHQGRQKVVELSLLARVLQRDELRQEEDENGAVLLSVETVLRITLFLQHSLGC